MNISALLGAVLMAAASLATAKTAICGAGGDSAPLFLLEPYLSDSGQLCFDVRNWTGYKGQNCVSNRASIQWQATATAVTTYPAEKTVMFRVHRAVVTRERLEYMLESYRGTAWTLIQHVAIDRLAGTGTSDPPGAHQESPFPCGAPDKNAR